MQSHILKSTLLAGACLILSNCQTTLVEKPKAQSFAAALNAERSFDYTKAYALYNEAAKSPNISIKKRALFKMSELLSAGNGVPKNRTKAIELLQEAVKLEDTNAILSLADAYATGNGITQDIPQARALYQRISETNPAAALKLYKLQASSTPRDQKLSEADQKILDRAILAYGHQSFDNNDTAMLTLAREYRDGGSVAKNDVLAERWFTFAVRAGNTTAAQELAQFWMSNPQKYASKKQNALQLLEQSASNGNVSAMLDLAEYYGTDQHELADPLKAQSWLKKAAESGNPSAMSKLGKSLILPNTSTSNISEGIQWLEKASKAGIGSASLELGRYHRDFNALQPNHNKAFEYFKLAKDQGANNALSDLANAYKEGLGTAKNPIYARQLLEQAVADKQPQAMVYLGDMLLEEPTTAESVHQALNYFKQAADMNTPAAHARLGKLYAEGAIGINPSPAQALSHHTLAANQAYPSSMEYLGFAYLYGLGTTKNESQGIAWLRKAAQAGAPKAMVGLAIASQTGLATAKNTDEASTWLSKAHNIRPDTLINVAKSFEQGKYTPKSHEIATFIYEKSIALGNPDARTQLDHLQGKGKKQASKSFSYNNIEELQSLASKGIVEAQFALASAYRNGKGIAQDSTKAIEWFTKAANQNHADAMIALAEANSVGLGTKQDNQAAYNWYLKAAQLGNASAQFQVGMMLARGAGVAADKAQAADWLKKSSTQGNATAEAFLQTLNDKDTH